jgi:hypothetical protein
MPVPAERRKAAHHFDRSMMTLPRLFGQVKMSSLLTLARTQQAWLLELWSARPQTNNDLKFRIQFRVRRNGIDGDVEGRRSRSSMAVGENWQLFGGPAPPKVLRKLGDLVSISMSSGDLISLHDVGLPKPARDCITPESACSGLGAPSRTGRRP